MKNYYTNLLCIFFGVTLVFSQNQKTKDSLSTQKLSEVILTSNRLEIPFSQNSKTVQLITADQIRQSGVTHLVDLLQQVSGVDIKRRGAGAAQADLNIRGGTFDQTLLLIDGIKLEDAQTGHHTLNFLPPPEMIERIEIIKGPAARAYGQNAFTGAINIVTKKEAPKRLTLNLQKGNYDQTNGSIMIGSSNEKTSVIGFISKNTSDGYRHNTDYDQNNYFIKSTFNRHKTPIDLITTFSGRKFGANGFYATPSATEQYEETQASLIALSQRYTKGNWILKPKVYWRRGQDMYEYIRNKPNIYRNLHITNKVGAAYDVSLSSDLGITGMGIDLSRVSIQSNNLGNRNRTMTNFFLEHRFYLFDNKVDITPGVTANYFSDFGWHSFPGIDFGVQLNSKTRLYGNLGSTFRIPTYTDFFYSDSTTIGNTDLKPEEANSSEIGVRLSTAMFSVSFAYFNRKAKNLIDYVKTTEDALWKAENIQEVNTSGLDFELIYTININNLRHQFKINYSYLKNELKNSSFNFSKYAINNDLKHHLVGTYSLPLTKKWGAFFVYKYVERTSGDAYIVVDCSTRWSLDVFELSLYFNNIFNKKYWESNLVPMPKGNGLIGLRYSF
ncbi:MAG: TonB-dependent receptor [Flavobacteriales bacterium MED-G15]|nr:MAG: TonB-dependent receptor [Flavobacteriales bacterium MED-G15]|tara:strand:- start:14725 stop:16560 length:1836 start_codon:yes stop_codon:yes gene_type:complete